MVLVHGWLGNRTSWAQQIDILAERYLVIEGRRCYAIEIEPRFVDVASALGRTHRQDGRTDL